MYHVVDKSIVGCRSDLLVLVKRCDGWLALGWSLRIHCMVYASASSFAVILMDDKAHPQEAVIIDVYLENLGLRAWRNYSSHLTLIPLKICTLHNNWDAINHISHHQLLLQFRNLRKERRLLNSTIFDHHLMASMIPRCKFCMLFRGAHKPY